MGQFIEPSQYLRINRCNNELKKAEKLVYFVAKIYLCIVKKIQNRGCIDSIGILIKLH